MSQFSPAQHPDFSAADQHFMQQALQLAENAGRETSPNPRVGCVVVREQRVIGRGWTQAVGQAHGEVQALRDAAAQGETVAGATAYVTLEPCAHYGRTPPCALALVKAGVARVVVAMLDPNPLVAGKGVAILREAGIVVSAGLFADQAREQNLGFYKRMEQGLPWLRLKIAASLDGKTALNNGQSQWITGAAARADGHAWRAQADAILTGSGTVLADDPLLNVRDLPAAVGAQKIIQPQRWVLDSRLRTPATSRLLQSAKSPEQGAVVLVHALAEGSLSEAQQALQNQAELLALPAVNAVTNQVELRACLQAMAARQINTVHAEAGAELNGALLQAGLVDEIVLYLAPTLLGPGRAMLNLPELSVLQDASHWRFVDQQIIGQDLRLRLRKSTNEAN